METLIEKPNFKVEKVMVDPYWEKPHSMLKLSIRINDKWVFVIRRKYDFYLDNLVKLGKEHDVDRGFFCLYGKGKPFDELQDKLTNFSYVERVGDNLFKFGGNHMAYSGAFSYYIWNKNLVEKIEKKLHEENMLGQR